MPQTGVGLLGIDGRCLPKTVNSDYDARILGRPPIERTGLRKQYGCVWTPKRVSGLKRSGTHGTDATYAATISSPHVMSHHDTFRVTFGLGDSATVTRTVTLYRVGATADLAHDRVGSAGAAVTPRPRA